jgi:Tfp pilus assembly protein PilN
MSDLNTEARAWKSLEFIRQASIELEGLVLDAKSKARKAKYTHALAVVRFENANTTAKVPATVRKEHALADPEVQEALKEADEADARLIGHNAQVDFCKEHVMLFKATERGRS